MAVRKGVLDLVGPFDVALGVGTPAKAGGDYDFFARILTAGFQIVYDPAALSWHRHRRTWRELRRTLRGYGTAVYALWTRHLLVDREPSVLLLAWRWFRDKQAPGLLRSLFRRPGHPPLDLVLAELVGCMLGPVAYLRARRLAHVRRSRS
jgi:SAM-dependent methyltransferase